MYENLSKNQGVLDITHAFADVGHPGDKALTFPVPNEWYECDIEYFYSWKHSNWTELRWNRLRREASSLNFLSPAGLLYALPAYLLMIYVTESVKREIRRIWEELYAGKVCPIDDLIPDVNDFWCVDQILLRLAASGKKNRPALTREQVMALESYFLSEINCTMGKEKGDIFDETYDHYVSKVRRNYRIEPSQETRHTACCKGTDFSPEMMQLPSPLAEYLSQYTRMRVAGEKLKELLSLWDAAQFVYSPRQEDFISHLDPNKAGVSSRVREELTSGVLHTLSNTQLKLVCRFFLQYELQKKEDWMNEKNIRALFKMAGFKEV